MRPSVPYFFVCRWTFSASETSGRAALEILSRIEVSAIVFYIW